jgi:hypothetical protein
MRNAPLHEAGGEGVEVVQLGPSGFEKEVAHEQSDQQRREPLE